MQNASGLLDSYGTRKCLDLARVLLVHGELAPRLALQTILQAGGYCVDVAASLAEAMFKLDEGRYELVLADHRFGADVLAYARVKEYRPATAAVSSSEAEETPISQIDPVMSIHTEDVSGLLENVAELIGLRASRRYRLLRPAV
jgi:CheY-like chemotaxis protein